MSAPPPDEPMPLPEAEGWWDYWTTTSGDERRAAITLRREYERLRGIAEAATAYVAHENNGRTRDSACGCPCQHPGQPCAQFEGFEPGTQQLPEDRRYEQWCPRCGWHRDHHPPVRVTAGPFPAPPG